jgi:DNA-binding XRE family transcriptional regulator
MTATVTLFTDRREFEGTWRTALERHGVGVTAASPDRLPDSVAPGATIVVDASAAQYDEDELLAHLGLARAMGATPAVALPPSGSLSSVDELVDELCAGLVTRSDSDLSRVAASIARRASANGTPRFEYLTVSPRGAALLAILADGSATLVERPVNAGDDGSEVTGISIAENAENAVVQLGAGGSFQLAARDVVTRLQREREVLNAPPTMSSTGDILADLDGPRLGARVRALRLAAGLTQAELARRTGIHRPNIARVEAGRHTPSLETLARLAAAIGVPTTRVLAGD